MGDILFFGRTKVIVPIQPENSLKPSTKRTDLQSLERLGVRAGWSIGQIPRTCLRQISCISSLQRQPLSGSDLAIDMNQLSKLFSLI